jgi:DNA-binding NarL/FixJ family response regulator
LTEAPSNRAEAKHIRVLIADDHGLVRRGLEMILSMEDDVEVVGQAASGPEALELALRLRPDVVLADISMPPPDGIEVARILRSRLPEAKTLIVTMHEDNHMVRKALAAGAAGYLIKRAMGDELLDAVRTVAAGRRYVDPFTATGLA